MSRERRQPLEGFADSYRPLLQDARRLGQDVVQRVQSSIDLIAEAERIGYPSRCMAATYGFTHPSQTEGFDFSIPSSFLLNLHIAKVLAERSGQTFDAHYFDDDKVLTMDALHTSLYNADSVWVTIVNIATAFPHVFGVVPDHTLHGFLVWDTSLRFEPLSSHTPGSLRTGINGMMEKPEGSEEGAGGLLLSFRS